MRKEIVTLLIETRELNLRERNRHKNSWKERGMERDENKSVYEKTVCETKREREVNK